MNLTRLVACGDSLTAGVGDPAPRSENLPGDVYGWVHRLVQSRADFHLVANLSRAGATVARLLRHQLDGAVALRPDVVTCVIGANDVLSAHFDKAAFERDYDHVIDRLIRGTEHGVLTMTLHDLAAGLPVRSRRRAVVRDRIAAANEVIVNVSRKHGSWLLDARAEGPPGPLGMLSLDRLHPNARGHHYLAIRVGEVLSANGVCLPSRQPGAEPSPPQRRFRDDFRHAAWLTRHLLVPLARSRLRVAPRRAAR